VELVVDYRLPCPPEVVFGFVDDLDRYPQWMGLVHGVTRESESAWLVELRARVGPFARSKRLRMVRVAHESPHHVRFERSELDGASHGSWVLDARLSGEDATELRVELRYGGRLWSAVIERVLRDEVERSKAKLTALVSG
jgi:carbon monoxide dehydrogenase subunit G